MMKLSISFSSKAPCNLCLIYYLCLLSMISSGCSRESLPDQGRALAAYGDQVLYEQEVAYFLPDSLSVDDSSRLTQQYIDEWVRGQVVKEAANQAINNLDERVAYLMRAYERSVIEHEYASHLLKTNPEKLAISEAEVRAYYEDNLAKFQSRATHYQYFYLKTPLAGQYKVVNLIRSEDEEKVQELIEWSRENATEYKLDSSYVSESEIERVSDGYYYGDIKKASIGTPYTYAHDEDGTMQYDFFRLLAVIEPGDQLPLSMCRERIVQVLRNQRKEELINKQINGLVKQAQAANKVQTY